MLFLDNTKIYFKKYSVFFFGVLLCCAVEGCKGAIKKALVVIQVLYKVVPVGLEPTTL
jgi:hypothetical protein